MEVTSTTNIIGNLAVCTTILQFLSGTLICRRYIATRTTGDTTALPFICGIISCGLWLYYGALKEDTIIIIVNFAGVTLMTVYTVIFYIFTMNKSLVRKQCFLIALTLFTVIIFTKGVPHIDELTFLVGVMASLFTLAFIAAPLSKLLYVIKTKNTECLPMPMMTMSVVVSTLWTLYGYLVNDFFILYVNVVGTVLALLQVSLFFVYPRRSQLSSKNISV